MNKKELKALRRPFIDELFRGNKVNFAITVIAAILAALSELVISWLIKQISDLISGDCQLGFSTLLIIFAEESS